MTVTAILAAQDPAGPLALLSAVRGLTRELARQVTAWLGAGPLPLTDILVTARGCKMPGLSTPGNRNEPEGASR